MFRLYVTLACGTILRSTHATLADAERARVEILASEADDAEFAEVRRVA